MGETHTKYLEDFGNARSKVDESYQEFADVERLHGGGRGKGKGGRGRGGGSGKGRGGGSAPVEARRERKPAYQADAGDYPGLPKPAPRDNLPRRNEFSPRRPNERDRFGRECRIFN